MHLSFCPGLVIGLLLSVVIEAQTYRPFPIDGGGAIQCLAVSPQDPNRVLAGIDVAGIARSTDGGMTWTMSNSGLEQRSDFAVADVAFGGSKSDIVYAAVGNTWGSGDDMGSSASMMRSEDGGVRWKRVSSDISCGGQITRQRGKVIIVDSSDANHLWIGTTIHGVMESKDGGKSWKKLGPACVGYITALIADPQNENRFYLGATSAGKRESGIWISADRGKTWAKKAQASITDIAVGEKGLGAAVGSGDVLLTQDKGATWQRYDKGLPADRKWESCAVGADPFQPGRFILAAEISEPDPFSHPKIFCLGNTEEAWQPVDVNLKKTFTPYGRPGKDGWQGCADWFAAGASGVFFHPAVKGKIYITDWYGVNVSVNGGNTWKACYKGLCTTVPQSMIWDQAQAGHVYLGLVDVGFMEGWILPNGTLKAHSLRDTIPGSHATPRQFVFHQKIVTLVGMGSYSPSNRIYRRVGLGKWELVFDNQNRGKHRPDYNHDIILAADERTGEILGTLTTGQVVRSRDGGKTWSRYADNVLTADRQDQYKIGGLAFREKWIVCADGQTYTAGVVGEWKKEAVAEGTVCPANSRMVYRVKRQRPQKSADELLQSRDGGKTWASIFTYPWGESCDVAVTHSQEVVYAFWTIWEGPGMAVSTDGGKSWTTLPKPPGYGLGSVVPDPKNPRRAALGVQSMGFWLVEVPDGSGTITTTVRK